MSDLLLSKLGEADLTKLWTGELSYKDPRVMEVLRYFKELVDMKAFPPTFSTMTLAESHRYFHTQEKACMFVIGSWYTGRAFADPQRGGQPKEFELGMLKSTAMKDGKGVGMKFLGLGGGFGAVSKSPFAAQAVAFIATFADESIGSMWTGKTSEPTALKTNPAKIESERRSTSPSTPRRTRTSGTRRPSARRRGVADEAGAPRGLGAGGQPGAAGRADLG